MSAERVYAVLLRLYPRRFRQRYGPEAIQTFTELSVGMGEHRARFWARVLADLTRSVAREHIDEWTGGDVSLARRWIAACAISLLIWRLVVPLAQIVQSGPVGAVFPLLLLGAGQAWALKRRLRVASLRNDFGRLFKWSWTSGVAVAGGAALAWGIDVALARLGLVGVGAPYSVTGHAVDFAVTSLLFGLVVGLCQALLLVWTGDARRRGITWNDAVRVVGWTTGALPAFALAATIMHGPIALVLMGDWSWRFEAMVVRPIVNGVMLGLLTVRPIAMVAGRGRQLVA